MKTATAPLPPLRSVRFWTSCVSAYAAALQLTNRTGLCPLGSCLHPFPRCASPGNGQQRSRGISVRLANERKVSVSRIVRALALLFFYGKVLCHGSALAKEIGRPRPSRRLPVVLTPDEVVRILGFLEGEHRFVRPASVWNRHADQ